MTYCSGFEGRLWHQQLVERMQKQINLNTAGTDIWTEMHYRGMKSYLKMYKTSTKVRENTVITPEAKAAAKALEALQADMFKEHKSAVKKGPQGLIRRVDDGTVSKKYIRSNAEQGPSAGESVALGSLEPYKVIRRSKRST